MVVLQTKSRKRAKFSGRKYSVRGNIGFVISILALISLFVSIYLSFLSGGNSSLMIGSAGLLCFVFNVIGFVLEIMALTEEDIYKMIPATGLGISILGVLSWIGIYVMGILYWG